MSGGPPVPSEPVGDLDRAWDGLVSLVGDLRRLTGGLPEHEEPEAFRHLLRFLAAGIRVCVEADDTRAPMLTRSIEHGMVWGLDNPDASYLYHRLEPGGAYRLRGTRGSARHLEVQVSSGHHADGEFARWRSLWSIDGDELGDQVDLSLPAPDGASFVLIRQYFSDWQRERPARLDLQRVDVDLPPAPLDEPTLMARLAVLQQWLSDGAGCWAALSAGLVDGSPDDLETWSVQPVVAPAESSGLRGQAYGMGGWRCEPDQALILTVLAPGCRYWGVSVCDRMWQSIDFAQRQSSLNDSQARPDADGAFTMVVAHDDPGVANWLDPGAATAGTLAVRYLHADVDPPPPVAVRRVERRRLAEALPEGVEAMSPAERQRSLRQRQAQVSRRLRW